MVDAFLADLEIAVSSERLERYRLEEKDGITTASNYLWNIALSEALYAPLSALEVTLRNTIHRSAADRFQTEFWFDLPGVLLFRQPDAVIRARRLLDRDKKPQTAGRIIAELNFGFWTTLLSDPYHASFWMPDKAKMLKAAFPHMTNAQRIRDDIFARYNSLRILRNRVFHFEPIWNRDDLPLQHEQMLEAIGWISPTVRDSLQAIDHFSDTFTNGHAAIVAALTAYLKPVSPGSLTRKPEK